MKQKMEFDNLYVACSVFDAEDEIEMYEQYETQGVIRHHILVSPKKVLIYSKVDENGNIKYYNYETGEEVKESSYQSSFDTKSSPFRSLYCGYINGLFTLPIPGIREQCKRIYEDKKKEVGYFIPFSQFMQMRFGITLDSISPSMAHKILRVLNATSLKKKAFELSLDPDTARKQLEEQLGYQFSESKKVDL